MTVKMPWAAHCSEEFANMFVPGVSTVAISITGIGDANISKNFKDVLRLQFDDVEKDYQGYVTMTPPQAAKVAEFLLQHRGKNFFVHCAAGISRSGAIVESILETFPEYQDGGHNLSGEPMRHANGNVKSLVKRALGNVPIGA